MKFGDRLKQERLKHQLTQQNVANQLNVSRQMISSWENENSYPDIDSLIQISNLYQLSLDVLLKKDVGMKEYLKKREVLAWIKPITWFTLAIDVIFLGSFIFIKHQGIMGALLLLIALFNVLVMMRIRNFKEQLMGKSTLSQWPTKRKVIWPLVIGFTSMTVISWYLNVGDTSDASWLAIGFWIVALADEIIYYQRKKHGTL